LSRRRAAFHDLGEEFALEGADIEGEVVPGDAPGLAGGEEIGVALGAGADFLVVELAGDAAEAPGADDEVVVAAAAGLHVDGGEAVAFEDKDK
jgi:hypothetical protein